MGSAIKQIPIWNGHTWLFFVGGGWDFSKVMATFSHVGGSFNLLELWLINYSMYRLEIWWSEWSTVQWNKFLFEMAMLGPFLWVPLKFSMISSYHVKGMGFSLVLFEEIRYQPDRWNSSALAYLFHYPFYIYIYINWSSTLAYMLDTITNSNKSINCNIKYVQFCVISKFSVVH